MASLPKSIAVAMEKQKLLKVLPHTIADANQ